MLKYYEISVETFGEQIYPPVSQIEYYCLFLRSLAPKVFLAELALARTQKETRKSPSAPSETKLQRISLFKRQTPEGERSRPADVTGRLRNDFRNRLSCRSEEKFGNFLGLICWSVSIEMLRGLLSQGDRTKEGRTREA